MKKILLLTFMSICFIWAGAQPAAEADQLIAKLLPENDHGLSVLIAQNGKVIYRKNTGFADVEAERLVTPSTTFRIGSVTKQFTAAAILKLAEMNKISLDDNLSKYIPEFPRGDEVTIHHLLTHTSGIKSYTDQEEFLAGVSEPISSKELIDHISELGYDFDPGEDWKYNNSGYFILGHLVEKTSGKTYGEFLKDQFFKPLGMDQTGVYENNKEYKEEALGYANEGDSIKIALDWDMTWAGGAGNLYSTANDLQKWNEAIFTGEILSKEILQKAHQPVLLNDKTEYPYGYGWGVGEFRGLKSIGHSGGLHGFLSNLVYYPDIDASVVILSNAFPPKNVVPAQLSQQLSTLFFEKHLEQDTIVEADTAEYKMYVGKYEYPQGAIMTVSTEGGKLYAQVTGQQRFEIYPKGEKQFFWKVVDAEVQFHLDEQGKVDYAMHKQGGMQFKAPKMEEQKMISMSPEEFSAFSGEYLLNGALVKVWEENGEFYTQIQGQPKFQLYPKSENRFFLKEMAVEVSFTEGEPAESMTIYQGGQALKANRKE